ncbi:zinc finger B-box domain-containing protein 1 isoform X2 [Erinaceus europaeus]|uniref:Zinc finger B-box domain-containing protein 1 isoform X2 n=1 Tax=Erinaceus europaeus TaxID=9365 RepID=A0ABM3VU95_ERIEU|nr:zinc finger B-box domain-containing protein 1 isoform X2 [Erinaceus europaeus]
MNTKDFIVLPWGKPGNTVKLKYKNAQELRMEKVQLELDTQDMEMKLQEFHSAKRKEKEERQSNGFYWKSGQLCKMNNQSHMIAQHKENVKLSTGKVKLKLLKEQRQEPVKQHLNYRMVNPSESKKPMRKGKVCGQCENKAALLVCFECGEDYCSGCFAKIHQKGALKLHRTTLLQAKTQILSSVLDAAHHFIKEVNPDEPQKNCSAKEIGRSGIQHKPRPLPLQENNCEVDVSASERAQGTSPPASLLIEGSFDEDASAQSFQEALNQWRTGRQEQDEKQNLQAPKPESLEECEVQTNLKVWREPLKIEFKEDSLSYMQKIWLKKHRSTPQKQPGGIIRDEVPLPCETISETICPQNEHVEVSEVDNDKVQQQALFLPVEELIIERPEPALRIVELDDTNEEEYEEIGNVVPYKVELATKDSQQSCTIHGYQNTFMYGNDILHHHVFIKGKTDLLHLRLNNCFSYCKDISKGTSNTSYENTVDSDIYSTAIENLGGSSFAERNSKEKNINIESNMKPDDSSISLEIKNSFPRINNEQPSIKEKLSEDIKESLEFSNLFEKTNSKDSKTESPLLLQEIALRSKPITEQYQGLERFFVFGKTERLHSLPSQSLDHSSSSTWISITGDRDWIPDHSVSAYASAAVDAGMQQNTQNSPPERTQKKRGKTSQRPSTANLPFLTSGRESSSGLSSPLSQSRSVVAQSLSRSMTQFPEIESADTTDPTENFLDDTAQQKSLTSFGKGPNMLKNVLGPSEKLYNPASEELAAFNNHLLDLSHSSPVCSMFSLGRVTYKVEGTRSSEKDTEIQSFCDSSTDEEEEEFSWQEANHHTTVVRVPNQH